MVSELNIFAGMWSKIAAQKKVFFADFALQNMVEISLPDGLKTSGRRVANFGISLDIFEFFRFGLFFPFLSLFFLFFGFCVFLVHPTVASVLLSASVERFDVSRMWDFFNLGYKGLILILEESMGPGFLSSFSFVVKTAVIYMLLFFDCCLFIVALVNDKKNDIYISKFKYNFFFTKVTAKNAFRVCDKVE